MNRCPSCFGQKQVKKLGFMTGPCDTCKATGVVDDETLKTFTSSTTASQAQSLNNAYTAQTVANNIQADATAHRARIKNANVAFMNQPVLLDPKRKNDASSYLPEKPLIEIPKDIKQAPDHRTQGRPLQEHELMKLRAETAPREDNIMAAQKAVVEEPVAVAEPVAKAASSKAKGTTNGKKERKQANA